MKDVYNHMNFTYNHMTSIRYEAFQTRVVLCVQEVLQRQQVFMSLWQAIGTCAVHFDRLPVRAVKKRTPKALDPDTAAVSEQKKQKLEHVYAAPPTDRLVFKLRGKLRDHFPI